MVSPTAPVIDQNGISVPQLSDVLSFLQSSYRQIYGQDIYLDPDSQDGQFLGIIAQAIADANNACVAVYNSFSPLTAQGVGLSNNVKINGIRRKGSSNSTADLTLTGTAGTVIQNGVVGDANGYKWDLPASVTLDSSGQAVATATCETTGAIAAPAGSINQILTPLRGWQAATNDTAASVGTDVEKNAKLRQRQAVSTALPSQAIMSGIIGAVANVSGVTHYRGYENDTGSADANGIPAHNICMVVEGGSATDIAKAIATKKPPGIPTYGTTNEQVADSKGLLNTINFMRTTVLTIQVTVVLTALTGYLSTIGTSIQQAIVDYINAIAIGGNLRIGQLYAPADLYGAANSNTYDVTSITIGKNNGAQAATDLAFAFDERPSCVVTDVTLTVN